MTVSHRIWLATGALLVALVVSGCSRSAQSHFDRGNAYLQKGDEAAAVIEFRNAVRRDATFAAARVALAEIYAKRGNFEATLGEYIRAADLLPNDAAVQLRAGSLLLAAGRVRDAGARADRALALDPKNADALALKASALAGLRDFDGAIAQIREAIALAPDANTQATLGTLQFAKGQREEAEATFKKAIETDPSSLSAQLSMAQFLWATGRAGEAEAAFRAAWTLQPDSEVANRFLATFYLASDRITEAEPYLKTLAGKTDDPAAKLALADYYVRTKRTSEAVAELERLSASPGSWAVARTRLAATQYAGGKAADAHATVDAVIAKYGSYPYARVVRGQFLLTEGKLDEALADAQQAVKLDPRSVEAQFLLGAVHQARRSPDEAAASFREVLRLNPRAAAAQTRLAALELERGAFGAATELAEQASRGQPGALEPRLLLTRSLLARGDLDRATTAIRQLLAEFPQVGSVHAQAGMLALRRGELANARASLERALSLDPDLVEPLAGLAALDVRDGAPDRARARIEARLKRTPRDATVLVLAARTWSATGDRGRAEEFLRQAIESDPADLNAYAVLGQLYIEQGKLELALAEYEKQAARQPGAVGPATMAAVILEALGRKDAARQRLERIVEADPRAAVASNNLAYMYASQGEQLDRALQLAQAAKAELPDDPAVSDTLGYVYIRKQLPKLAMPLLQFAIEQRPTQAEFHYHMGLAYSQAGDADAARRSMREALRLKTDFEGADEARRLLGPTT